MSKKTPSDFQEHADWTAYVRQSVPEQDQAYALADGRTDLFVAFCRSRGEGLPVEFQARREAAAMMAEPTRTATVEVLNKQILATITQQLHDPASSTVSGDSAQLAPTPRERVDELVSHLVQKNVSFVLARVGPTCKDHAQNDVQFIAAMADLDKLLSVYWERNKALPPLTFERAWFLHYLREPERMLQTRAVLHMLTEGLDECMSA